MAVFQHITWNDFVIRLLGGDVVAVAEGIDDGESSHDFEGDGDEQSSHAHLRGLQYEEEGENGLSQ